MAPAGSREERCQFYKWLKIEELIQDLRLWL